MAFDPKKYGATFDPTQYGATAVEPEGRGFFGSLGHEIARPFKTYARGVRGASEVRKVLSSDAIGEINKEIMAIHAQVRTLPPGNQERKALLQRAAALSLKAVGKGDESLAVLNAAPSSVQMLGATIELMQYTPIGKAAVGTWTLGRALLGGTAKNTTRAISKKVVKKYAWQSVKEITKEGVIGGALQGGGAYAQEAEKPTVRGALEHAAIGGVIGGPFALALGGTVAGVGMVRQAFLPSNLLSRIEGNITKILRPTAKMDALEARYGKNTSKFLAEFIARTGVDFEKDAAGKLDPTALIARLDEEAATANKLFDDYLDTETAQVSLDDFRIQALRAIDTDWNRAKGSDYQKMVQAVIREVDALKDNFSTGPRDPNLDVVVPIRIFNRIKQGLWNKAKGWATADDKIFNDVSFQMGHTAKEIIELGLPDADVKLYNQHLGDIATAKKLLEKRRGFTLPGGRLGRYFARTIGGMAGSSHGPVGVLTGSITADFLEKSLQNPGVSNKLFNTIIQRARKEAPDVVAQIEKKYKANIEDIRSNIAETTKFSGGPEGIERVGVELAKLPKNADGTVTVFQVGDTKAIYKDQAELLAKELRSRGKDATIRKVNITPSDYVRDVPTPKVGKMGDAETRRFFIENASKIKPTTGKYQFRLIKDVLAFVREQNGKPRYSRVLNARFTVNNRTLEHLYGNRALTQQTRRTRVFGAALEIVEETGIVSAVDKTTDAAKGITYYEIVGTDGESVIRAKVTEANKNGKLLFTVDVIPGGAPVPTTPSSGRSQGGLTTSGISKTLPQTTRKSKGTRTLTEVQEAVKKRSGMAAVGSSYGLTGKDKEERKKRALMGIALGVGGASAAKLGRAKAFKGFKDLTTGTLDRLVGHSVVAKRFILDLLGMDGVKKAERAAFMTVLDEEGTRVPVQEFANKVKTELLPLKRVKWGATGRGNVHSPKYENIALPEEERGPVASYSEHIYNSPIENHASNIHFGSMTDAGRKVDSPELADGYFAHTRVEDLPTVEGRSAAWLGKGLKRKAGSTRRVIEIQSDLFQKDGLDPAKSNEYTQRPLTGGGYESMKVAIDRTRKELAPLEPYRNTWHERIIREEVKQAAVDGKTKLQFPTGETAMKIEGLGDDTQWVLPGVQTRNFGPEDLVVGKEIHSMGHDSDWVITDVLGDGKFKAVPKGEYNKALREVEKLQKKEPDSTPIPSDFYNSQLVEQFDISGKVDKENPIYKFYGDKQFGTQTPVGKYLQKKYGATQITDKQGVSWWQVKIGKGMSTAPVEAFAGVPFGFERDEEGNIRYNPKKALAASAVFLGGLKAQKALAPKIAGAVEDNALTGFKNIRLRFFDQVVDQGRKFWKKTDLLNKLKGFGTDAREKEIVTKVLSQYGDDVPVQNVINAIENEHIVQFNAHHRVTGVTDSVTRPVDEGHLKKSGGKVFPGERDASSATRLESGDSFVREHVQSRGTTELHPPFDYEFMHTHSSQHDAAAFTRWAWMKGKLDMDVLDASGNPTGRKLAVNGTDASMWEEMQSDAYQKFDRSLRQQYQEALAELGGKVPEADFDTFLSETKSNARTDGLQTALMKVGKRVENELGYSTSRRLLAGPVTLPSGEIKHLEDLGSGATEDVLRSAFNAGWKNAREFAESSSSESRATPLTKLRDFTTSTRRTLRELRETAIAAQSVVIEKELDKVPALDKVSRFFTNGNRDTVFNGILKAVKKAESVFDTPSIQNALKLKYDLVVNFDQIRIGKMRKLDLYTGSMLDYQVREQARTHASAGRRIVMIPTGATSGAVEAGGRAGNRDPFDVFDNIPAPEAVAPATVKPHPTYPSFLTKVDGGGMYMMSSGRPAGPVTHIKIDDPIVQEAINLTAELNPNWGENAEALTHGLGTAVTRASQGTIVDRFNTLAGDALTWVRDGDSVITAVERNAGDTATRARARELTARVQSYFTNADNWVTAPASPGARNFGPARNLLSEAETGELRAVLTSTKGLTNAWDALPIDVYGAPLTQRVVDAANKKLKQFGVDGVIESRITETRLSEVLNEFIAKTWKDVMAQATRFGIDVTWTDVPSRVQYDGVMKSISRKFTGRATAIAHQLKYSDDIPKTLVRKVGVTPVEEGLENMQLVKWGDHTFRIGRLPEPDKTRPLPLYSFAPLITIPGLFKYTLDKMLGREKKDKKK